jgi:hypothetical protein
VSGNAGALARAKSGGAGGGVSFAGVAFVQLLRLIRRRNKLETLRGLSGTPPP